MNSFNVLTEVIMFVIAMCVLALITDQFTVWYPIGYVIGRTIGYILLQRRK